MKSDVVRELHALLRERLFGGGPWLADLEITMALNKKIDAMGVSEPAPGALDSQQWTPLGRRSISSC
jgi:hypothetical protein